MLYSNLSLHVVNVCLSFTGPDSRADTFGTVYLVVHLFGAVEDVDHDTERSPEVLGGLCFAGASWSSRCSAHCQMQRLRKCDVASAHTTHHIAPLNKAL